MLNTASTAPAAPSRWPTEDLVLLIASPAPASPHRRSTAPSSRSSPIGVLVPCALTYCTCPGVTPASRRAMPMERKAPSPVSEGAVM